MAGERTRRVVPIALAVAAAGMLTWAQRDYRAWRALGLGGLPATWGGWLRMTQFRIRAQDPLSVAALLSQIGGPGDVSALAGLRPRRGDRPLVAPHPVPHRQLNEHAPRPVRASLRRAFNARVTGGRDRLGYARSHFERHHDAITLREESRHTDDALLTHGEIAHVHPADYSMHMVLSPSDARTVIERRWGELHRLAGIALGLPATYTLIYAPRNESDVRAIARILDSAIAYIGQRPAAGSRRPPPQHPRQENPSFRSHRDCHSELVATASSSLHLKG